MASQARARAARHPLFTLSSSLWTLKEYPSPYLPQVGEGHGSTAPPLTGYVIARQLRPPRKKRPRRSQGSRAPQSKRSRSGHGIVIRFVFRRSTEEAPARSLPRHPDSHAAHLHPP
jgi:hypothetical protein